MSDCDFGLIGLGVMGKSLAQNVESRGFKVGVFDVDKQNVDAFSSGDLAARNFVGSHSLTDFVASVARPRRLMMLVPAGSVVDSIIDQLIPLCDPGDIIIDGGNTHFADTERRTGHVESAGLLFVGCGVSGGEEGALKGPSLMPGGSEEAWPHIKEMFQAIAAKVGPNRDVPCCEWVGARGAGHYVKMVHNGIEYGDMQLICEAYQLLRELGGLNNGELYDVLEDWNRGELESYLIEISRDIFSVKDDRGADGYLVDKILDIAGAKGTGKWMSQLALDLGVPSTLVTTAVFARGLSAQKEARVRASESLNGPSETSNPALTAAAKSLIGDREAFIESVRKALYASKIVSYAQGFVQLQAASDQYDWRLDYGNAALLWRGGCIIRARFLDRIKEAFDAEPKLENLLLNPFFETAVEDAQESWRAVVAAASILGIPLPAFSAALCYYDGYRMARLPANLLQAQRDYFGAHTYQRVDKEGTFHSEWLELRKTPVTS